LPAMAESMRGPPKIMPSLKRQHHFTRTMPILWREHHYHPTRTPHFCNTSRAAGPGGRGLASGCHSSPLPLVSFMTTLKEPRALDPISTHKLTTPRPRGRRTSPACGSCRRPLKNCEMEREPTSENQRIERNNGAKKESERGKTRVGRSHGSKGEKVRFASTRARRNENAAHTCTEA
jgi:hypothetical protein